MVSLIGFYPFKHAAEALSNINAISEGIVTEDLKLFLETNVPKVGTTKCSDKNFLKGNVQRDGRGYVGGINRSVSLEAIDGAALFIQGPV